MHPSESVTNVPLNEHQTAATQTIGASLPLPDRPTSALEQPPTPLHLSVETLGAETVAIVPTLAETPRQEKPKPLTRPPG
jgi:hypothetical protein